MRTLDDDIIYHYRIHPKTGPMAETKAFSELSDRFHEVFKQCVRRAVLRGDIVETPQTPDFWEKLINSVD